MLFGVAGLGIAIAGFVLLRLYERRVERKIPLLYSIIRPVVPIADVAAAMRARTIRFRDRGELLVVPGSGVGRRLFVRIEEEKLVVACNEIDLTAEVLAALADKVGELAVSIPILYETIELHVWPLEHERMTLAVAPGTKPDVLADRIARECEVLNADIVDALETRMKIVDILLERMKNKREQDAGPDGR